MSGQPTASRSRYGRSFYLSPYSLFIGFLVWSFFRVEFLEVLRYLRLAELGTIGLFTDQQAACYAWLKQAPVGANVTPTVANIQAAKKLFWRANSDRNDPARLNRSDSLQSDRLQHRRIGHAVLAIMCIGHSRIFFLGDRILRHFLIRRAANSKPAIRWKVLSRCRLKCGR